MKRNAVAWAALVVSTAALVEFAGLDAAGARRPRRSRPRGRRRPRPCPRPSRRSPTSSSRRSSRSASSARRASTPSGAAAGCRSRAPRRAARQPRSQGLRGDAQAVLRPGRPAREAAVRPRCRGDRLGVRLRRQGPHPDQQPRRRRARARSPSPSTTASRRRPRSSAPTPSPTWPSSRSTTRLPPAPQGREQQAEGRRAGSWPSGSPFGLSQTVTAGHHLGDRAERRRDQRVRVVPPDRRGDQPGQLGRAAGRHERPGRRHQLGDRHRQPGQRRRRLRHPDRHGRQLADKLIKDGKVSCARVGIQLGAADPGPGQAARPRPEDQGRPGRRGPPGEPGREGGPEAGRRDHRVRRQARRQRPVFRLNVATSDVGKSFS